MVLQLKLRRNPQESVKVHASIWVFFKDGRHLLESGKKILANNFIVNLNESFFVHTRTHHPPISL